ncbi:hypothetical protein [Duganella callida]|uniref:hypothetical protein n=1 Tax=Duganella callida TaxID=2561932 RepID=UPI001E60A915|nr:hypothetical protein [Duganella callida]
MPHRSEHPRTPDGRYVVVRGRLWRMSNPGLSEQARVHLVKALMDARRAVKAARKLQDAAAESAARAAVDATKRALGERGPVWCGGMMVRPTTTAASPPTPRTRNGLLKQAPPSFNF